MKKVKHRLVEKMNESTADSLGLSRAVLVNGIVALSQCLEVPHNLLPLLPLLPPLPPSSPSAFSLLPLLPPLPSPSSPSSPPDKLIKKVNTLEKNAKVYRGKQIAFLMQLGFQGPLPLP